MHEPEFYNLTPFVAEPLPLIDRDGADCRVVVVKASYALAAGRLRPLEQPRELRYGDEMWGPPEIADIKYPADVAAEKPGTDVVVVAEGIAPNRRPATSFDVGFTIGTRRKRLRVTGPRQWRRALFGMGVGRARPATRVRLSWANAYGGYDASNPQRVREEPRNPVGSGVCRAARRLIDTPAPQVENPGSPVRRPNAKTRPAGCAALGRHFEPRRAWAGSYDAAWLESRHPARPTDYDPRHENFAPPDQVFSEPLKGGEPVELLNLTPDGTLRFVLPREWIEVEALIDGKRTTVRPHLDSVVLDGLEGVVELCWRAGFRCPAKMRGRFQELSVKRKEFA